MKKLSIIGALFALSLASGAMAQQAGQLVSGRDYSTTNVTRPLNVDSTGRLQVVGSAVGGSVYGNNATGTAPTQPPVLVGGWDGTNVRTALTDATGRLVVNGNLASGASAAATGISVGGQDGTNFRTILTDTAGRVVVNVNGTAAISAASLPLPTGAATETSLVKLPVAQASTTAGQSGPLVQGAVTTANPTYTTATTAPLSLTTGGYLRTTDVATVGQGSTTAGQVGPLLQASATTLAPSYTANTTNPLSMDLNGGLRVNVNLTNSIPLQTRGASNPTSALSSVAASVTSVTVLASNSSARGRMMFNDTTADLYLCLTASACTTSAFTVKILGGGYYEVPFTYTGQITGIWSAATGSVRVTEIS